MNNEIIKCVRVSEDLNKRILDAQKRLNLRYSDIVRICIDKKVDDLKIDS